MKISFYNIGVAHSAESRLTKKPEVEHEKIISIILILSTLTACGLNELVEDHAIKQIERRRSKIAQQLYGRQARQGKSEEDADGTSAVLAAMALGILGIIYYCANYYEDCQEQGALNRERRKAERKERRERKAAAVNQAAPLTAPEPEPVVPAHQLADIDVQAVPITAPAPEPVVRLPDGHTLTIAEAEQAIAESINIREELEYQNRKLQDSQPVRLPNGTPCTIPVAETLLRGQANILRQQREALSRYGEECRQVFAVT